MPEPTPLPMRSRLRIYWFLFMGGLGAVFPFLSLYFLENAALTGTQVGVIMAAIPLVGFLAQPFWGQVADRTGSRARILALVSLGAGLSYAVVPLARGFSSILLVMALVASFSTAVVPMATSVTLASLGSSGPQQFGTVRVWGTVGFLILVMAFPVLLNMLDAWIDAPPGTEAASEPLLGSMFVVTGGLWILASGVAITLPPAGDLTMRAARGEWRRLLRHRPYRRIVLFAFGSWLCLQGPMILFPIYVRSWGGDVQTVSLLWIPMLALEIPLVAFAGAGLQRFGARGLVALGLLAGAVRWCVCALTTDPWILYPVQLLHGVVVAGVIIGAPLYVEESVPVQLRSTGQGVLAMLGFGVGGTLSNVLGGWLLDRFGAWAPPLAGGVGAFVLVALLPFLLPPSRRPAS